MTLLLTSVLLGAALAAFVVAPLLARRAAVLADVAPGAVLDAVARKRAALASLKEIEYDFLGGKLDAADYQAQRDLLSREAIRAMREADSVTDAWGGTLAEPEPLGGARKRARLDAELAARAGVHRCGYANPAGSRFCAGCGKRLR